MTAAPSTARPAGLSLLCVSSTGQPWGAELALATYLRHRPTESDVRALCLSDGPLVEILREAGVPATASALEGRPTAARAAAFVRNFHAELRRSRPAAIYATGNKAAILCAPAAVAANVPLVFHRVDLAMRPLTLRAVAFASSGVIAVSRAAAAGVPNRRLLTVVPPPVRLPETFGVTEKRPPATIGSVGQLHPVKGHHDVIEAAGLLAEEFSDLRVVIAGGPHPAFPGYTEQLRATARRLGIGDRVEVVGHVARIEEVYETLTVLVSGTYRDSSGVGPEALGAAIAEASWAGLPVVATIGGGTREVVDAGVTGQLVPPREPASMAEAIAQYLRDPRAARAAGAKGAELARAGFRPAPLANALFSAIGRAARPRAARILHE